MSAGHHEQENKKTTSQIKFFVVTIKQQIKLLLQDSLCKLMLMYLVQMLLQFHPQHFLSNQGMHEI